MNKIKISTFNVHMFTDNNHITSINNIFEDIKKIDADIIVLQEALFFKVKKYIFMNKLQQTPYKYFSMCNEQYGINIILSKFPLTNIKVINLGKGSVGKINRYALKATVDLYGNMFDIIGCHLDVYDETENSRVEQMNIILKNCSSINTIIIGDFNSLRFNDYTEPEWNKIINNDTKRNVITQTKLINLIEQNGFIDSFVLGQENPPNNTTMFQRRVDYIYIKSPTIKGIHSSIIETTSSDHYPVITELYL